MNTIIATTLVFLIANNGLIASTKIIVELKEKETLKSVENPSFWDIIYI